MTHETPNRSPMQSRGPAGPAGGAGSRPDRFRANGRILAEPEAAPAPGPAANPPDAADTGGPAPAWQTGRRAADGPRIVGLLVGELFDLACGSDLPRAAAARRPNCHVRQITMYLCHVLLSMRYTDIARLMGRDRTTVVHACAVVEDRRDDRAYDRFVERCERCVRAVFALPGESHGEA